MRFLLLCGSMRGNSCCMCSLSLQLVDMLRDRPDITAVFNGLVAMSSLSRLDHAPTGPTINVVRVHSSSVESAAPPYLVDRFVCIKFSTSCTHL